MTSRRGGTVSWTGYNLPLTITHGGGNSSTFTYGPDRSRYRQQSLNGTTTEDRTYVGGLFEKLTSSALAAPEYRHYIVANGVKIAVKILSAAPRNDVLYLHDDHLGGTDVITNAVGTVLIRESNDAWGHRRGSAWTGSPSTSDVNSINTTTHIGYTGQEDLDNLSLIDLNGRVYDPVVARFMSADPYVQAPFESQSLNRYSYTWNNPLNHTDPMGFGCVGSNIASASPTSAACNYSDSPGSDYINGMKVGIYTQVAKGTNEAGNNSAATNVDVTAALQEKKDKNKDAAEKDGGASGDGCKTCTVIQANTFDASRSDDQTVAPDAWEDLVAEADKSLLNVSSGDKEKMGFIVVDETGAPKVVVDKEAKAKSTLTADTESAVPPPGAIAVIHGHITNRSDGMIDDVKGPGDAQSLTLRKPMPNYTVSEGRVGVHEVVHGRLQFRMLEGTLSKHEIESLKTNLNREQQLFLRPSE